MTRRLEINSAGADWLAIAAYVRRRIDELHIELEQPLDLDLTHLIRGQITALRRLIDDGKPPQPQAETEQPYT